MTEKNMLEICGSPPHFHDAGSLLQLFLRDWERFGNRIAIADRYDAWSYRDVFSLSVSLAKFLQSRGIGGDDLIVVVGDRCAAFVIFLMGVLMAGGRFIVIDPTRLTVRSVEMLRRLKPKYWLSMTGDSTASMTPVDSLLGPADAGRSQCPSSKDELRQFLAAYATDVAANRSPSTQSADNRAYAIWTSGTAGAPKLVSTCHGSVANFLSWYIEEFELRSEDRFSLLSGLAHDPMVRDIFTPLSIGATLCIPSEYERMDPTGLRGWLDRSQVTVAHLTPSLMNVIAKSHLKMEIPSMRLLAFGGEQLTMRHVSLAKDVFPNAEMVNFYGATETPQAMGYYRVPRAMDQLRKTVPIGQGIRGAELMLLTQEHQPTAVGEEGELYVRSRFLSEGYIGRPEETSLRFLINPLTGDAADRVFRTGDFGFVDPMGAIHLTGRRDRQVKVNGHRVDLDDIQAELAAYPTVAHAVVTYDEIGQFLVAYVVRGNGVQISEFELRDHIATNISIYSVPAKIVFVESIPITRNGKVDYRILAALPGQEGKPRQQTSPQQLGEFLKEVWAVELSLPAVHSRDNFLDLGGDSITANRIVARINGSLEMPIRPADLFIYPTVEALEAFLTKCDAPRTEHLQMKVQFAKRKDAIENARRRRHKT